jgi:indolepyruvate ferredoxin oxidoreductase alpha subunit
MERSFAAEVKQLALGEGQTLRGEGILAITKALLQSATVTGARVSGEGYTGAAQVVGDARRRMLEDENAIDALLPAAASRG